jgi:hypothetical protein
MPDTKPTETLEDWLDSHSRSVKSAKISHAHITPGPTIETALVKSNLTGQKQLNGLMFFLLKLENRRLTIRSIDPLNGIPRMIHRVLIGLKAIGGEASFMATEADVGVIDQAYHQTRLTGKPSNNMLKNKKGYGFLKKHEQEGQGGQDGGSSD